ncbi:MAG: MEDS domain-containing protein [Methanomassiliicoccales archaeon]|nr:MEDS domain-containing protein [Methanomassiliicoccales archaeon]
MDLVACAGEREKVVLFSDSTKLSSAVGKRVGKAPKGAARLSCLPAKGVVYPEGRFEVTEVLESIRKTIEGQRESGQTSMIVVIDMSWLQERPEWFRSFMQVDVSLNLTKFRFPVTLVCQYDLASLSAEEVETINSVHAVAMTDGKVSRNFWLIPRRGGTFEDMGLVPEESQ